MVTRQVAGQTLLVPIRGELASLQRIMVLNPVGEFIWQRLDGATDLAAILRAITTRFAVAPGQAEADLLEFVASLAAANLVQEAGMP